MLHFEVNTPLGAVPNAPSAHDLSTLPPIKLKSGYALGGKPSGVLGKQT